jgi:hypothetical protein
MSTRIAIIRLVAIVTGTVLAAIMAVLLAAGPAAAADGPRFFTSDYAGSARFQDKGDHVYLCDHREDGHSVGVRLSYLSESDVQRYYARWNWWGPHRFNGCKDINTAAAEGTPFMYRVCLGDYAKPGGRPADAIGATCSGWAVANN